MPKNAEPMRVRFVELMWFGWDYEISDDTGRQGWQDIELADDRALLDFLKANNQSHIDLSVDGAWACAAANPSRCIVVEALIRDARRRIADREARAVERKRADAERQIEDAQAERAAALARADELERNAKEALASLAAAK